MSKLTHDLSGVLTEKGQTAYRGVAEKFDPPLEPGQVFIEVLVTNCGLSVSDLLTAAGLLSMMAAMSDLNVGRSRMTVQHLLTYLRDSKEGAKAG